MTASEAGKASKVSKAGKASKVGKARECGPHIVQYPSDYSLCAGCTSCEIVCTLVHDGVVGPRYNRIFLVRQDKSQMHTVAGCMHCSDHPCYNACPKQGEAMILEPSGMAVIIETECIGCGKCANACVCMPARINLVKSKDKTKRKAKKCDLCKDREGGPACVEWCPVRCIGLSTQERPHFEPPAHAADPLLPPPTYSACATAECNEQLLRQVSQSEH